MIYFLTSHFIPFMFPLKFLLAIAFPGYGIKKQSKLLKVDLISLMTILISSV